MATLTKTTPALSGTTPSSNNASSADQVANPKGKTYVRVINGGGGSINCTVVAQSTTRSADGTFPSMTLSNQVVAVGAGVTKVIGPIPPAFVDGSGYTQLQFSGTTSVTVEAWDAD